MQCYRAFNFMQEIEIKIRDLEDDIQLVLNKVDSYSNYGRTPTFEDRLNQLRLLEEYKEFIAKKAMLEDLLTTCQQNAL